MATKTTSPRPTKNQAPRYLLGIGRRKTAVARVRLHPSGSGKLTINSRELTPNQVVLAPFVLVGETGQWDVSVKVRGGGIMSQQEAIRHGITRALVLANGEWRQAFKKAGFLRRDPREKERKKYGLKRARRAPQWAKR